MTCSLPNICSEDWISQYQTEGGVLPVNFNSHRSKLNLFLLVLAFALLLSGHSLGQDDFFSTINVSTDNNNRDLSQPFSLLGRVTQKVAYGLEDPGELFSRSDSELSKVETGLFLQLDWLPAGDLSFRISGNAYHDEIFRINDDTSYTQSERNEFRNRFDIRDFYVEKQLSDNVYLKAGNQILAWGFAEYLRVTDIINTEDQYALGQQDLEDLRLQVPATLLSVSIDDWVLDGVVTYKAGYHDVSPAGDEFDQFIGLRRTGGVIDRHDPDNELEYFFRASTRLNNGDLQIVAGEFNNNALGLGGISNPGSSNPIFHLTQERIQALGVAANRASGSWLVFGELGMHFNNPVFPDLENVFTQAGGWQEKDQILGVLGLEYNGFANTIITLETDSIRTQSYDSNLLVDKTQHSFGGRLYWTGWNERLEFLSVWNKLANSQGYVTRVSLEYDWSDNLDLGFLWVDYKAGNDSIYYNFRNNDMLQFSVRYSFQN